MSEEDAKNWFNDKSHVEFSIAQLVSDIKEYVSRRTCHSLHGRYSHVS